MNPIFVIIFALNAAVALFLLLAIARVGVGAARFNSGGAAVFNFILFAACAGIAAWAYPQAFGA